jgi:PAS domain S-box-containing protein
MKPTYKDLQQRIAELELALTTRLHEHEALYKTLVENLPLAIAIFDKTGKILYANEMTEIFLRQEKGSVTGKTAHQVYPKETADDMVKLIRQVIKTQKPINVERSLKIFGKSMHLKVTRQPLFNENGKVTSVFAIGEDITAQKRQLQLLNIQHQIDSLSNVSGDLKSSLDLVFHNLMQIEWIDNGGIYLLNDSKDAFELIYSTGFKEKSLSKVSYLPVSGDHARILLKRIPRYVSESGFMEQTRTDMIAEGLKSAAVIPLVYRDEVIGALNLGSRKASGIDEFDKEVIESIASRLANLIMLVKTQIKLDLSNSELNTKLHELSIKQQMLIQKSRLESLGELSAGLAHEINQPLSVISLVMENIQYKFEKKEVSENYLVSKFITITQNINKIRNLIAHVRLFSRDQGSIMFERVDVNQVILSALSMVESQMKNNQIILITELHKDIGNTVGNPSRFEQVMLNLLSNARDALVEKEKKTMSGIQSKEIRITTSKVKDLIFIRVWDNGTGISEANLDKIFNPFFTTKTDGRGTGLGLPIVYGIITEMKGNITARSKEGEFTEITFTLPHYKKMLKKNDNL